jgi:hypothetical protein
MDNYGDPTDEWRGMASNSTHTICFNTGYGIPNLMKAFQDKDFPDAQVRHLDEEEHDNIVSGMHRMHDHFDKFTDDNLADCLAMMDLYKKPPASFPWTAADMKLLYKRDVQGAREEDRGLAQEEKGLPVGKVGQVYLVKSDEPDGDAFLIGIIRAIATDPIEGPGVKMQWFELADPTACRYTSKYKSHTKTSVRVDKLPFCSDDCLQYLLRVKKVVRETSGVVKSLFVAHHDVENVKYYEERFINGSDLHGRDHERVLPAELIHYRR